MEYWIILILMLSLLIGLILYTIKFKNSEEFIGYPIIIIAGILIIASTAFFTIDIPSAVKGGETVYVDVFPEIGRFSSSGIQYVLAGDKLLFSYHDYKSEKFEKDAKYCISYTAFTKIVLNIKKIEE